MANDFCFFRDSENGNIYGFRKSMVSTVEFNYSEGRCYGCTVNGHTFLPGVDGERFFTEFLDEPEIVERFKTLAPPVAAVPASNMENR
jgi:hypothetical protein